MEELKKLLLYKIFIPYKLISYGFIRKDDLFYYEAPLVNDFSIKVWISIKNDLQAKVIDNVTNDEYVLVKVGSAIGEFVKTIKNAYLNALLDIISNCSETEIFKSLQAKKIIQYMLTKYEAKPEYLWEKYPNYAVFRNKDSQKWYAVIMVISKDKLGLPCNDLVEIIVLRCQNEEFLKVIDNKKFFLGYHMNKKHWFTLILNNEVELAKIKDYIDLSYALSK